MWLSGEQEYALPPWAVRAGARKTIYHDPAQVRVDSTHLHGIHAMPAAGKPVRLHQTVAETVWRRSHQFCGSVFGAVKRVKVVKCTCLDTRLEDAVKGLGPAPDHTSRCPSSFPAPPLQLPPHQQQAETANGLFWIEFGALNTSQWLWVSSHCVWLKMPPEFLEQSKQAQS